MSGFSVVVPSYNSSSYIGRAFKSIEVAAKGRPFEILVVDDLSSDFESLEEVCSQHSAVRLIKKEKKTNAAHSRNLGVAHSHYDLVFLLDSDDVLLESAVDQRLALHEKYNAGVIFGNYITKRGEKQVLSTMQWEGEPVRDFLFGGGGDFRTSTISIYKPSYKKTKFDEEAAKHQDWIFGMKCCDAGEDMYFDSKPISIINVDTDVRMSSKLYLDASRYLIKEYLCDQRHVNGFSKKHWRSAVANEDAVAIAYYTSIFLPARLSDHLSKMLYQFLAKGSMICLSSRAMRFAKKVKWLKLGN